MAARCAYGAASQSTKAYTTTSGNTDADYVKVCKDPTTGQRVDDEKCSDDPIIWNTPTHILYAENDNITSLETMMNFANKIGATVTVMNHGEHWFHTEEQMNFLDNWFRKFI